MQVEIMRHHRCTEDTDADVEHFLIEDYARAWNEAERHPCEARPREKQFNREACPDCYDEGDDQRLDVTEAFVLKIENSQHIECGNNASHNERDAEKQLQANG